MPSPTSVSAISTCPLALIASGGLSRMRRARHQAIAGKEDRMKRPDLNGLIAAIVTPMRSDLSIDEESLRRYVEWLVGQGVRGLAVNVDTGEGPHLFPEERLR